MQTPEELDPIARGPKSTGKRPKHVKPKSKACLEILELLRTPSSRGMEIGTKEGVGNTRADPVLPDAEGDLRPGAPTESEQLQSENVAPCDYSSINCMARVWGGGRGGQCSRKRKDGGDYCRKHSENNFRPHGRIDGEVPEGKRDQMKTGTVATGSASSQKSERRLQPRHHHNRLHEKEVCLKGARKQGRAGVSVRGVKVVPILRGTLF